MENEPKSGEPAHVQLVTVAVNRSSSKSAPANFELISMFGQMTVHFLGLG